MGPFRFSIRGLIVAVAVLGFDAAAMTRAVQMGRKVHSLTEYALGFGLVLLLLNAVAFGLYRFFARAARGPRGRLRETPSPVLMAGVYLAVLSLAILSVLFFSSGRF
jgi:hypothetical protein